MHPRVLVDGFEIAKKATIEFLEKFKTPVIMGDSPDKEILKMVARTTLRTKVPESICDETFRQCAFVLLLGLLALVLTR
jgi:T-complex protein 1 subunit zeta